MAGIPTATDQRLWLIVALTVAVGQPPQLMILTVAAILGKPPRLIHINGGGCFNSSASFK
jgi:hypothetical protein